VKTARATQGSNGLVLAGAAALGAYEVGVLAHVFERVLPEVGGTIEVFSGTSAGAINATAMAAFADQPESATRLLARAWSELELAKVVRPSSIELLSMVLDVAGAPSRLRRALQVRRIRGGLLDREPIARLVAGVPTERISEQIRAGLVRGAAISATRVSSGGATVFYEAPPDARPWRSEANVTAVPALLTADHVLASAAIPLLFPAVLIDGEPYCDGGLRQMVPLSPALHLGADRLLVVNPLPSVRENPARAPSVTSPLYLAGKALNTFFADRVEVDLMQLERTTAILRAGERRFGPSFEREINRQLALDGGHELRAIDAVCIEPSRDLGLLAAEFVTSRRFASSVRGTAGWLLRRIADGDPERAGDLLAYLLFDGGFTSELVALGRADARAQHARLAELLAPRLVRQVEGRGSSNM
jgi:NTE family protein